MLLKCEVKMQTNTDLGLGAYGWGTHKLEMWATHAERSVYVQGQHAPRHPRRCGATLQSVSSDCATFTFLK